MVVSRTRTRAKAQEIEEPEVQHVPKQTQASIETATPGIMRNSDMLTELRKQREEISLLSQKAAAAEERAFQMQSTIKELKAQLHVDVKELYDQLQETRSRLKEVVKTTRNLESASRNEARKHIAEVRDYVQEQQEQKKHKDVHLVNAKEDDVQSTTSQNMRAEGLMHLLEEARSEVGTTISYGPHFW
eukprot:CAMPEP_0115827386 /NCGR_PEP_ID=MMETSP0287-20121206/15_1 /TAXON_ID=412157 /ORGANISM="Chrysochromulina rotalis, Strain UIO044" /LENGTH=187 /DNA_ID=CAMNT_0003280537 /DNA_START=465 /DNA_END=1028 /DNA_ORIENTATION=-